MDVRATGGHGEAPASHASAAEPIAGIAQVADRYDGYILDVWGTLYDGGAAFPGAVDALALLRRRGARIAVLSNSPRLPPVVTARLDRIGIGGALYDVALTSGGETPEALRDRSDAFCAGLGRRVYQTGPVRFPDTLPADRYDAVDDPALADWILCAGPAAEGGTIERYDDLLAAGRSLGLPMVCANPDVDVIQGGRRLICAGAIAQRYAERGGVVRSFGKPARPTFERAAAALGVARDRILVVGDNLGTDILGAVGAGLDSLWLSSGIHAAALLQPGGADRLYAVHQARPRYVAARLEP